MIQVKPVESRFLHPWWGFVVKRRRVVWITEGEHVALPDGLLCRFKKLCLGHPVLMFGVELIEESEQVTITRTLHPADIPIPIIIEGVDNVINSQYVRLDA